MWKRSVPVAAVLVLSLALFHRTDSVVALTQASDDLVVHEWGTFTTIAGADGKAMPWLPLGGSTDLPCFVESYKNREVKVLISTSSAITPAPAGGAGPMLSYQAAKSGLKGTVRMETPVLYFYASRPTDVAVNVRFTQGLFTEWYPKATVLQSNLRANPFAVADTVPAVLRWPQVSVLPGTTPTLPNEREPSHYYAARDVDAAPVQVAGQSEKFLFYRGVGGFSIPVSATLLENGSVTVTNLTSDPVPGVVLFTRQGGKIGYRTAAGVTTSVTIDAPVLNGSLPALRLEVERLLVDQGLYPREAHAMVMTWDDSWFDEGTRVLYVVPATEVERVLPLQIDPKPRQIARAFIGRTEVITPAVVDDVSRALDGNVRAVLAKYGRFLGVIGERVLARTPESADKARIESVLDFVFKSYLTQLGNCD